METEMKLSLEGIEKLINLKNNIPIKNDKSYIKYQIAYTSPEGKKYITTKEGVEEIEQAYITLKNVIKQNQTKKL